MKTLYLESIAGIAGDMFSASFIDAGLISPVFKKILTEIQNPEELNLENWLAEVIKSKEHHSVLIDGINRHMHTTITTDAYMKGVKKHWMIATYPLPTQDLTQLIYIQDISSLEGKKSYWDLHLRVSKATMQLIKEISERKRLEAKAAELNHQLVTTARRAGMADVATSILHNVGNILNSVRVSVRLLNDNVKKFELDKIVKIVEMIQNNLEDCKHYFSEDPKGKLIPKYLAAFIESTEGSSKVIDKEIRNLLKYIQHIEDIVSMQGSISGSVQVSEKILVSELIDSAIQLCSSNIDKNHIELYKTYENELFLYSDKFKILQILVNILQNATEALISPDANIPVKMINIKAEKCDAKVNILISDNGIGISPENITKIFSFGFTTKPNGHGFGLHSSALAAKELGGSLEAVSPAEGAGATFILTLPS